MRQISKRLEALERAADKEVLANAFPFAIAYYLGGARHESEVVDAYARAWVTKISTNFAKRSRICCASHQTVWRTVGHSSALAERNANFSRSSVMICVAHARQFWLMPLTELSEPFRRNGLPPSNPGIGNRARPRRGQTNCSKRR
jgi:hypothetical protein